LGTFSLAYLFKPFSKGRSKPPPVSPFPSGKRFGSDLLVLYHSLRKLVPDHTSSDGFSLKQPQRVEVMDSGQFFSDYIYELCGLSKRGFSSHGLFGLRVKHGILGQHPHGFQVV
jgi:hypothetical protein